MRIDISPVYFTAINTPKNINKYLKDSAKFLFLFRDPVERTISHFNYFMGDKIAHNEEIINQRKCNVSQLSFDDLLAEEYFILSSCGRIDWPHPPVYFILFIYLFYLFILYLCYLINIYFYIYFILF